MEKEKQLLILCRRLIEESLNWGDSEAWSNDDFEKLSEKIFGKTRIQLSISTLKRIWGKVRYENFPTAGTLNALAGFIGYESWRDFRQKNLVNGDKEHHPDEIKNAPAEDQPSQPIQKKQHKLWPVRLSLLAAGIFLVLFFIHFINRHKATAVDLSKIKFEVVKASDNLPNSVVFNYDASAFKSDSVYIQQMWDPNRRERVPGNGRQHTSIYYEPGFFIAKLVVDGAVEKQFPVFIKTQGWKGIIAKQPVPIYLSEKDIKGNGYMGISDSTLRQKTGSPVFSNTMVEFANVREFKNIDAGDFTFETTLRNSSAVEASACREVRVVILGLGTAMIIPLADKGCISSLNLLTGDLYISGKNYDMRAFGCDFSQFQTLKCRVEKRRLKIYLNDKLIMDTGQKRTMGEIVGLRFEFEGAAQIKEVMMSSPGKAPYYEHF